MTPSTFITGVSGFVGLALTEHLLRRGETVVGFDLRALPDAAHAIFAALPGRYIGEQGDVTDGDALCAAMSRHRPARLVSLAAVTAARTREIAAPAGVAQVNIAGAWNAITAATQCGVDRIVHASSGSVYGHSGRQATALHEADTPLAPEALYGITKQAAEAGALRLAELHGLDLVVARLGTCFGPWEADTGVRDTLSAPLQILRCAERGEPAVLPRDSTRDWLYVRDAAAGLAGLLATPHLSHRVYNVAAGFIWSLVDWCEQVRAAFPAFTWRLADKADVADVNIDLYAPYDRAAMDWRRLSEDTGFVPSFDLPAAGADYLAWRAAPGRIRSQEP